MMPDVPIYMLIFNDQLKRHNANQRKYEPPVSAAAVRVAASRRTSRVSSSNYSVDPSTSYSVSTRSVDPSTGSSGAFKTKTGPPPEVSTEPTQTASVRSQTSQTVEQLRQEPQFFSSQQGPNSTKRTSELGVRAAIAFKELNLKVLPLTRSDNRTTSGVFQKRSSSSVRGTGSVPTYNSNRRRTGMPQSNPLLLEQLPESDNNMFIAANKDSYPNMSQTPRAQLGNSANSTRVSNKELTTSATKPNFDNNQPKTTTKEASSTHQSLSKTIAQATPNAFKTLGPGFNRRAVEGKSPSLTSSSLNVSTIPSDYEHIFHAPSQLTDLPGVASADVKTPIPGKDKKKGNIKKQKPTPPKDKHSGSKKRSAENKRKHVHQNPAKPKGN